MVCRQHIEFALLLYLYIASRYRVDVQIHAHLLGKVIHGVAEDLTNCIKIARQIVHIGACCAAQIVKTNFRHPGAAHKAGKSGRDALLQVRRTVRFAHNKVIVVILYPAEFAQPPLIRLFLSEPQKGWQCFLCDGKRSCFALITVFQRFKVCHDLGVVGQIAG